MKTFLLTCTLSGLLTCVTAQATDLEDAKYFSIFGLAPLPTDPSNDWQKDPDAAQLGERLFFDTGMSANGTVACASCHFTEGSYVANESIPAEESRNFRSVPQITGAAYNRFFFWDGRVDSLWAQALKPIENPDEHQFTRLKAVTYVVQAYPAQLEIIAAKSEKYHQHLKSVQHWLATNQHSEAPDESINFIFALIGKSLAAFETVLPIKPALWDDVANAKITGRRLNAEQEQIWQGFKVFNGKARCSSCHDGPLFTDYSFHNTAMPSKPVLGIEAGRYAVLPAIKENEFGCYSPYSDAGSDECLHLKYINRSVESNFGAFKTPTLRGVSTKARLGHSGQFPSMEEMIDHYDQAPKGVHGRMFNMDSLSELQPIGLTTLEKEALLAFLRAL